MTQKTIKIFINEVYSKPTKRNCLTNKTDVYHIDDTWSLDILDLKDYGPESNKNYRYVLVIIDTFGKFGWIVPLKIKKARTLFVIISSERKPNLIETDRGKKFYNKVFQDFLNKNNIKYYSRYYIHRSCFCFNRSFRDLFKRPVFEKGEGNWIDALPTITKLYKKRIQSSTKLTPIQASLKKNEGYVYDNLLDKRKKKNQIIK